MMRRYGLSGLICALCLTVWMGWLGPSFVASLSESDSELPAVAASPVSDPWKPVGVIERNEETGELRLVYTGLAATPTGEPPPTNEPPTPGSTTVPPSSLPPSPTATHTPTPLPSLTPSPTWTPTAAPTQASNPTPTQDTGVPTLPPATVPPPPEEAICMVGIQTSGLNVRAEPSTSTPVIGKLFQAQRLEVIGLYVVADAPGKTEWYELAAGGWIAGWYQGSEYARLDDKPACWELPITWEPAVPPVPTPFAFVVGGHISGPVNDATIASIQ